MMLQLPYPVFSDSSYNFGAKQVSQNDENERLPNPVLSDSLYSFGAKQVSEMMKMNAFETDFERFLM